MKLIPSDQSGLWVNPVWQPGTQGTFAVVIGISQYDYLSKGLYNDNGGTIVPPFSQLAVSALTAYRFFEWLQKDYRFEEAPLAHCWFLAAPTIEEEKLEPMLKGSLEPTLENCKKAIQHWFGQMNQLSEGVAQLSRSFFFFSGHGIQRTQQLQLLLPKDYLNPEGLGKTNSREIAGAISSVNLFNGLSSLHVQSQFVYVDACRNDIQGLSKVDDDDVLEDMENIVPVLLEEAVLDEEKSKNKSNSIPIFLHAAAHGDNTYQPTSPKDGLSFFGQAILDGLRGRAGLRIESDSQNPDAVWVTTTELLEYVKHRVAELCRHRVQSPPRVLQTNSTGKMYITKVAVSSHVDTQPTTLEVARAAPYEYEVPTSFFPLPESEFESKGQIVFGNKMLATIMQQARIFNISNREWLEGQNRYEILGAKHSFENGKLTKVQLTLQPKRNHDLWFQFRDCLETIPNSQMGDHKVLVCLLPKEIPRAFGPVSYTLEFEIPWKPDNQVRKITHLEAKLALDNKNFLGQAAELWQRYEDTSAETAVAAQSVSKINNLAYYKMATSLSATVAGLLLLKSRFTESTTQTWLKSLAEFFPEHSDGLVLWVESRINQVSDYSELEREFSVILERGLPFLGEALSYAANQVTRFEMVTRQKGSLKKINNSLQRSLSFYRPGGLFTVLIGPENQVTPQSILHFT